MTRTNRALCVGINDYPGDANDLSGCVNDALDWAELLHGQGYEVVTLLNSAATRDQVLYALRDLIGEAKFGERVVLTYSGHGSWIPDGDGDEIDGRDEVMCTHDFMSGGLISDDDLAVVASEAGRGVGFLILSDSCFSGTVSRFAAMQGALTPSGTPRFIPPHTFRSDLSAEVAAQIEQTRDAAPRKAASLISGCSDLEYSYDASFMGRPNGAFSRVAIDAFRGGVSLNSWFNAIRAGLPTPEYPQSPQLTAATAYRKYTRAL